MVLYIHIPIRNAENIFPCLSVETPPTQSRPPSAKVNVYGIAYRIGRYIFISRHREYSNVKFHSILI